MSNQLYIPSHFPSLQLGLFPEQAPLGPHLHTPVAVSQLSVLPEQPESSVHLAVLKNIYIIIWKMW